MNRMTAFLTATALLFSISVFAEKPGGSEYIDGGKNKSALILAHGRGKYPTWLVVDPLRIAVNDKLGFHTLSLQMPTGYDDWEDYADGFPEAYKTIKEGMRFLRDEKGVTKIFLMGHSMGGRMASSFVHENPKHSLSGLIVSGCRNNGGHPLSCEENLQNVNIPVLDIWGGINGKDIEAASDRDSLVKKTYKQVAIENANHKFEGYEREFTSSVINWLKTQ